MASKSSDDPSDHMQVGQKWIHFAHPQGTPRSHMKAPCCTAMNWGNLHHRQLQGVLLVVVIEVLHLFAEVIVVTTLQEFI